MFVGIYALLSLLSTATISVTACALRFPTHLAVFSSISLVSPSRVLTARSFKHVFQNGKHNRELAQKPHEPHAAFLHCAERHGLFKLLR
jgi:hypothetical protein